MRGDEQRLTSERAWSSRYRTPPRERTSSAPMRGAREGAGTPACIIFAKYSPPDPICQAAAIMASGFLSMARTLTALGEELARLTREGSLYETLPDARVRCF